MANSAYAFPTAVTQGGTGLATLTTAYGVVCAGTTATGNLQNAGPGAAGQVLTSAGAAALPTWAASAGVGSMIYISTGTAAGSATIDFTGLTNAYSAYLIMIDKVNSSTDAVTLTFRTSTNNGVAYDAGASDYRWDNLFISQNSVAGQYSEADTSITLSGGSHISNVANEVYSANVWIFNPSAAGFTRIVTQASYLSATPSSSTCAGGGTRVSVTPVNAVRFLMSAGNIAAGTFKLYGII